MWFAVSAVLTVACAASAHGARTGTRRELQVAASQQLIRRIDLNGDGTIEVSDLLMVMADFGTTNLAADFDYNSGTLARTLRVISLPC